MKKNTLNRRNFIKGVGLGTMGGIILGGSNFCVSSTRTIKGEQQGRVSQLYKKVTGPAQVSLIKGNNRRDIVYQSLKNIGNEVLSSIGDKKILINPNIVLADNPLCATHVDAIRAILDFLTPHYKKQIIIGESSVHKTFDGYKNYGYLALEKEYNVKLVDLNQDSYQYRYVFGEENRPLPIRIISTFLDPEVYPDLAIIDGFESMEGNGPSWGTPFDSRIAIASLDALAADTLATKIMGFDPKRVLYLSAMTEAGMGQGEIERINVLGTPLNQCLYNFKPHEEMGELYEL